MLSSPQRENDTDVDASPLLPAGWRHSPLPAPLPSARALAFDSARARSRCRRRRCRPLAAARSRAGRGARTAVALSVPRFRGTAPRRGAARGTAGGLRPAPARASCCTARWSGSGPASARSAPSLRSTTTACGHRMAAPSTRRSPTSRPRRSGRAPARSSAIGNAARSAACWNSTARARRSPSSRPSASSPGAIGGLALALRVDRVDRGRRRARRHRLQDRRRVSAPPGAARAWMRRSCRCTRCCIRTARPAIAFAGVGAARARNYVGVGREAVAIAGVKPAAKFALTEDKQKGFGWRTITAHWRAWLERSRAISAAGEPKSTRSSARTPAGTAISAALCRVDTPARPDDAGEEARR